MNADYGTARLTCFDHRHVSPRPFSEHNPHSVAPSLVDAEQYPINLWRDVMQQRVGGRMHMQSRGHQEKQRLVGGEFASRKISEALELAALVMPCDSCPVVQTL